MKIKSSNYVVCVDIYKINIKCMTSSCYTKYILLPYFNICLSTIVYSKKKKKKNQLKYITYVVCAAI